MVQADPIADRTEPILCSTKASDVKKYIEEHGKAPSDIQRDSDMPDIDLDCLPSARDPLKEYAAEKYGNSGGDGIGSVCSVGTWQTYKFKSALTDVAAALRGRNRYEMEAYTKEFPQDADELREGGLSPCKSMVINDTSEEKECGFIHDKDKCPSCGGEDTEYPTLGKLLIEIPKLAELYLNDQELVRCATMLVGRVRNMGMHAGALIITDRPLFGNIPLSRSGSKGYWTSLWTEGRSTQLSKFGYVKWDVLGLKTLEYIFNCCKMIEQNRGITFGDNFAGLDDIDPDNKQAGVYYDKDGSKCIINLDDSAALSLANQQKTDAIFQFDTDLAKSILKNGVKNFFDLMLLNALGHPGPMQSIPDVIANRDDYKQSWKSKMHPEMLSILEDTYGHLVYQEQLQAAWQNIAGFTAPEAQEARKAVAKKWTEKLKPIKEKWVEGASKKLGLDEAELWWTKMATFGRYAFNRCLSKDTLLYDPVSQVSKTVEQWRLFGKPFKLYAYDGQNVFIDTCVCIHDNGANEIFEVKFDDGSIERLTAGHKLLCEDGQYHEVSQIFERGLDVKKVESYRTADDAEDARQGQSVVW